MTTVTPRNDLNMIFLNRQSVRHYDASHTISEQEIREMLEITGRAPSSWNLQHWKFIVINQPAAKEKLLPIAYNQQQVVDASVTIAILGDLEANRNAETVYRPIIQAGLEDAYAGYSSHSILLSQIDEAYRNGSDAYRRDEAIRNASLAAMQLMLVAEARGYDSGPMVGFDAKAFVEAFDVPPRYIPVLLVAIGRAARPARPTSRLPVEDTILWNGFGRDSE